MIVGLGVLELSPSPALNEVHPDAALEALLFMPAHVIREASILARILCVLRAHDNHTCSQDMTRVNSWSLPASKSSSRSVITDVPCMRVALPSTWSSSKPRRSAN